MRFSSESDLIDQNANSTFLSWPWAPILAFLKILYTTIIYFFCLTKLNDITRVSKLLGNGLFHKSNPCQKNSVYLLNIGNCSKGWFAKNNYIAENSLNSQTILTLLFKEAIRKVMKLCETNIQQLDTFQILSENFYQCKFIF